MLFDIMSSLKSFFILVFVEFPLKCSRLLGLNEITSDNLILICIYTLVLSFIIFYIVSSAFKRSSIVSSPPEASSNFRKRDTVRYYAKRFTRKYLEITESLKKIQSKEVRDVLAATYLKRLFRFTSETRSPLLDWPRLPDCFFEPDETIDSSIPEEIAMMLNPILLFGQSDGSLFMEFCKYIETVNLEAGNYLFKAGDPDEYISVVYNGKILLQYRYQEPPNDRHVWKAQTLLTQWCHERGFANIFECMHKKASHHHRRHHHEQRHRHKSHHRQSNVFNDSLELGEASPRYIERRLSQIPSSPGATYTRPIPFDELAKPLGISTESTTADDGRPPSINQSNQQQCRGLDFPTPSSSEVAVGVEMSKADAEALRRAAEDDFAYCLDLSDSGRELLRGRITLSYCPSGTILFRQGETHSQLWLVVSGQIHAKHFTEAESVETSTMFVFNPGETFGLLGLITDEYEFYFALASVDTVVAVLPHQTFHAIVAQSPDTLLMLIRQRIARITPLLHMLDTAIEVLQVQVGKALYRIDDVSNAAYVVLSGRLRQVDKQQSAGGDHRMMAGELGRGDLVGLAEVVFGQRRGHTVMAIRDSEVARIPSQLLQYFKQKEPQVWSRFITLLSGSLMGKLSNLHSSQPFADPVSVADINPTQLSWRMMSNLRTIAILPSSPLVDSKAFGLELQHALTLIGPSVRLTPEIVEKRLGLTAFDCTNHYQLSAWLSGQEDTHRMVLFVCDYNSHSDWTRLCIRQADCVLVLALGNADPSQLSPIDEMLRRLHNKVSKALVLMYPLDVEHPTPGQTAKWLNIRPWISHHFHIRCERRVLDFRDPNRLIVYYSHVFEHEKPNPFSDFSRLARCLTGEAVGLVLGGGGARGCAHVGVIRAFQEAGLPIDMIGGTSIGAFMSALWAEETRIAQFTQRARNFAFALNSNWNRVKDITYPGVSLFSGEGLNRELKKVFGDRQIEDLWLPTFYTTTDLTACTGRFHTRGSLWRYVRASMSLSGFLPPLCDPYNGNLLLDGGYTNNVPADVMTWFGAKTIIAVDVGALIDTGFTNYGDSLSGWKYLYHKIFFPQRLRVPNLSEIQSRLGFICCVRHLEKIKSSGICHYLRPPIEKYSTLQFGAFDEIVDVGYECGKSYINEWRASDQLSAFLCSMNCSDSGSSPSSSLFNNDSRRELTSPSLLPPSNHTGSLDIEPGAFVNLDEMVRFTSELSPGFTKQLSAPCTNCIGSPDIVDSSITSSHHRTDDDPSKFLYDRSTAAATFHGVTDDLPLRRMLSPRKRRKRLYSELDQLRQPLSSIVNGRQQLPPPRRSFSLETCSSDNPSMASSSDRLAVAINTSSLLARRSHPLPPSPLSFHNHVVDDASMRRPVENGSITPLDGTYDHDLMMMAGLIDNYPGTPTVESDPEFDHTRALTDHSVHVRRTRSMDDALLLSSRRHRRSTGHVKQFSPNNFPRPKESL